MPLQGILKGRASEQVVPAAARALPENSPTAAGWPQAARILGDLKICCRTHCAHCRTGH